MIFVGWVLVLLFLCDILCIGVFWFHGASADVANLYVKPASLPDLTRFPYSIAAAWPYPPVIFDFAEKEVAGGEEGREYTWLRMNYISQVDDRVFNLVHPAQGSPSIANLNNASTVRTGLMQKMQGKNHDDPIVLNILSRRIVKLDSGWVAEIEIEGKKINFYPPKDEGRAESIIDDNEPKASLAPLLEPGAAPTISKPLSGYFERNEWPLVIARGGDVPILVAGSRGTVVKLDESGRFLGSAKISKGTGSDSEASGFWTPIGGVYMGKYLVSADTVLSVRRFLVIVLLATPLLAYLSFAWARR